MTYTKPVQFYLDSEIIQRIDYESGQLLMNRSEWIRAAIREKLHGLELDKYGKKRVK